MRKGTRNLLRTMLKFKIIIMQHHISYYMDFNGSIKILFIVMQFQI